MQIAFTIPVSVVMHNFWNETDDVKRQVELVQFAKVRAMVPADSWPKSSPSTYPAHSALLPFGVVPTVRLQIMMVKDNFSSGCLLFVGCIPSDSQHAYLVCVCIQESTSDQLEFRS
jgi:hypothetical protein